jgi:mRNA interferase RelE/StbE
MKVALDAAPTKYLERLDGSTKARIRAALAKLGKEPPQGDIKKLKGRADYRLRVGNYRVLYRIENKTIFVLKIAPRGQAY